MIFHIAEVWGVFAVAFTVGCIGGAILFRYLVAGGAFASVTASLSGVAAAGLDNRAQLGRAGALVAPRQPARRAPAPQEVDEAAVPVWDVVDRAISEPLAEAEVEDDTAWLPESADDLAADEPEALVLPSGGEGIEAAEEAVAADAAEAEDGGDDSSSDEIDEEDAPAAVASGSGAPRVPAWSPQRLPIASGLPPIVNAPRPLSRPRLVASREQDAAPPPMPSAELEIRRPAMLKDPRNGVPDNLQRIRGIGERNEVRLNRLGIWHFSQIAAWTPAEVRWIGEKLAFPERIERDDWVGQAIVLASGKETGFTKSAERRRARRRDRVEGEEDSVEES